MKKNNYSGKLIVIEGLDGSGQSTQVKLLRDFLIKKGFEAVLTKEPTLDSKAGEKIREILDEKIKTTPSELQDLFVEDRKEHLEELIIPALKEDRFVVLDRYLFSTLAYGAADGLDLDELIKKNNDFLLPDITFILNVSAKTCISRIEKRGTDKTLFEKEKQLSKVLENYKLFPKMFDNVKIVDGEKSIDEVFEDIKKVVLLQVLNGKEK